MESKTFKVGATGVIEFDFSQFLSIQWIDGYEYALADFVRPTAPNGFVYECTNAGQSNSDEPEWPTTIAQTIDDGSVEWTCRDFSASGSDSISSQTTTAETGVTVDSSAIDGTRVDATITCGTKGCFIVTCEIDTAAGETEPLKVQIIVK